RVEEDLLGAPRVPMEPGVVGRTLQEIDHVLDAASRQRPPLGSVIERDARVFPPRKSSDQSLRGDAESTTWRGARIQEAVVVEVEALDAAVVRARLGEIEAAVDADEFRFRIESLRDLRMAPHREVRATEQAESPDLRAETACGLQQVQRRADLVEPAP